MVDYADIGKRIRACRLAKGMTQEQLANEVGVVVTHISHIETGNSVPSLKTLIDIINALDCSADEPSTPSSARTARISRAGSASASASHGWHFAGTTSLSPTRSPPASTPTPADRSWKICSLSPAWWWPSLTTPAGHLCRNLIKSTASKTAW